MHLSVSLFLLLCVCLWLWCQSYRCLSSLFFFIRDFICFISYLKYISVCGSFYAFLVKSGGWGGGGGVTELSYGSSPSSYMDCVVIFGVECFHIRRSGVCLDQCFCVGDFVMGLIIFGSYFYGSTTFRMSIRRLPVLLFVSRFECPYILLFVARCAYGGRGGNLLCMRPMARQ